MRRQNNGFRKRAGKIVEGTKFIGDHGPNRVERGEILSQSDIIALNRCCKRRGIRTGNLSAQYTEIEGVRFY